MKSCKTVVLTGIMALIMLGCNDESKKELTFEKTDAYSEKVAERIQQVENGLAYAFIIESKEETKKEFTIFERMEYYKVPGVSIAVINDGSIEWIKGYGELRRGSGKKVNTESLFQSASIGKALTAMAALAFVEQGKIELEEDVNRYLKSWKVPENEFTAKAKVTLGQLLSHSGGTTVHGFGGYAIGDKIPNLLQILDGLEPANTGPVRVDVTPGTVWRYSGGGYLVVQQIMEDITGKKFPQIMEESVLGPAGMKNSLYLPELSDKLLDNVALAYRSDGNIVPGKYHIYPELGAGAGLWTTPSDLARFAIEIQKSFLGESNKVLSGKMVQEMLTRRIGPSGLGLMVKGEGESLLFFHSGGNVGYRTFLCAYAETGKGAAIMTNSDVGMMLYQEILRAIARVYGWPDFAPEEKVVAEVNPGTLDSLAGRYNLQGMFELPVFTEDGKLFIPDFFGTERKIQLYPQSSTKYFDPLRGFVLEFILDENSRAEKIKVFWESMIFIATRIE